MNSFLVYKFNCGTCSHSYTGETCHQFKTRIEEHIQNENKSHIFKYLHSTTTCFDSFNFRFLKIIDKVNSKFNLKIKESLYINCKTPDLNAQQNRFGLTLLLLLTSPLSSFLHFFCLSLSPNNQYLSLSELHFAIASSRYNTPCITYHISHIISHFLFIYYFNYI